MPNSNTLRNARKPISTRLSAMFTPSNHPHDFPKTQKNSSARRPLFSRQSGRRPPRESQGRQEPAPRCGIENESAVNLIDLVDYPQIRYGSVSDGDIVDRGLTG